MALHRWLQGDRSAPEDVVEAAVDIILAEGQGLTKPLSGPLESRGDRR
jgi:hypothetical protein